MYQEDILATVSAASIVSELSLIVLNDLQSLQHEPLAKPYSLLQSSECHIISMKSTLVVIAFAQCSFEVARLAAVTIHSHGPCTCM